MGVLNWITQGCDALTSTASPTIDALGLRICIALATIMLVWFGVQESLASVHGTQGFHMGKFLSFFMLITFAYTFVRFYDTSIPGIGQSFRGFINGGAQYLVSAIGTDSITTECFRCELICGTSLPRQPIRTSSRRTLPAR
jgi:hypothetical protein